MDTLIYKKIMCATILKKKIFFEVKLSILTPVDVLDIALNDVAVEIDRVLDSGNFLCFPSNASIMSLNLTVLEEENVLPGLLSEINFEKTSQIRREISCIQSIVYTNIYAQTWFRKITKIKCSYVQTIVHTKM